MRETDALEPSLIATLWTLAPHSAVGPSSETPLGVTSTLDEPGDREGDAKSGQQPDNEPQQESPWARCS
jgi:hypothetical protein